MILNQKNNIPDIKKIDNRLIKSNESSYVKQEQYSIISKKNQYLQFI